jgi:hypothetical protein
MTKTRRAFGDRAKGRLAGVRSRLFSTPLFIVFAFLFALAMRLWSIHWGLPATDGWDNDGIAPRDFLSGVVLTYRTGEFFTYPPLHLLLLSLLTVPLWLPKAIATRHLPDEQIVRAFLTSQTMTPLALTARIVAVVMSLACISLTASIAAELVSGQHRRRARTFAWVLLSCSPGLTYYGQTSNLDVPYVFWLLLSLRAMVQAVLRERPGLLGRALLYGTCAVCTKDQAYAGLLFPGLALVLASLTAIAKPSTRTKGKEQLRWLSIGGVASLLLFATVDGALFNPSGFQKRLAFLRGSASQDHAIFTNNLEGFVRFVREHIFGFDRFFAGQWLLAFGLLGVVWLRVLASNAAKRHQLATWLPLLMALSFSLAFDWAARRNEHRFVLLQSLLLGGYAAIGFTRVWHGLTARPWGTWVCRIGLVLVIAAAARNTLAIPSVLRGDPRYEAERFLEANVAGGDTVVAWGTNAYLPRMDSIAQRAHVLRGLHSPIAKRSQLPNVTEVENFGDTIARANAEFLVLPEAWADPILSSHVDFGPGRNRTQADADAARGVYEVLMALREGRHPKYVQIATFKYQSTWFSNPYIHAATGHEMWVFKRRNP